MLPAFVSKMPMIARRCAEVKGGPLHEVSNTASAAFLPNPKGRRVSGRPALSERLARIDTLLRPFITPHPGNRRRGLQRLHQCFLHVLRQQPPAVGWSNRRVLAHPARQTKTPRKGAFVVCGFSFSTRNPATENAKHMRAGLCLSHLTVIQPFRWRGTAASLRPAPTAPGCWLVEPAGSCTPCSPNKNAPQGGVCCLAERAGFEPAIELPLCHLSRVVTSTTHPPLRNSGLYEA